MIIELKQEEDGRWIGEILEISGVMVYVYRLPKWDISGCIVK
jgi:hypothetical protein